MAIEFVNKLLSTFGKKVGISHLHLDDAHGCCLYFDEILTHFQWDEENDVLLMNAVVASLPELPCKEFYAYLLEGNHFFQETSGGVLGIDQENQWITFSYNIPVQTLDYSSFEKLLENFLNMTEKWQKKVEMWEPPFKELSIPHRNDPKTESFLPLGVLA